MMCAVQGVEGCAFSFVLRIVGRRENHADA
jgi:hypothetical protein